MIQQMWEQTPSQTQSMCRPMMSWQVWIRVLSATVTTGFRMRWRQCTLGTMKCLRKTLPQGPAYLCHVLGTLKNDHPDHFHKALRISPGTFDKIVDLIMHVSNNSNHPQIPIEMQLANAAKIMI